MQTKECPEDICEQLCEHPQIICIAKKESISDHEAQQVAEIFKLLGDPTRVKILQALTKRELCVCDLAAVIEMGQSAVSHQLRLLRNARLVRYRREGKMAWYSLDDEHVRSLLSQGIDHIKHR
ncbi:MULTISPECIES: ArsR/SmtB family transcription factor [Pelosinus]|uniref:Regulatory protein ArsR n=1 Tax=Pelosinus fermentans B4 TaxID=1149862 RepID=I9L545_9FIRM|nr:MULTISPECIES: metalloregulator ArsR/SmtB family transcription factor [Pelosinus]EIW15484.1 regulatory protein ArsR [Pelosinus fermentans B4]EIW26825.1 transcriptional regulator, ArsR family [Pelosinus fermentans A11]OAM92226.1 transcriptional regulator, ArsR family [Pelosinus fermentans DSM 17108]SDQ37528.1 DNA-binding transcriptional regulator, ArsR family [Pelosinus fermentans]